MSGIELFTLGRLAVVVDGAAASGVSTQPVRAALLVYLAVEGEATRDAVIGVIWPEYESRSARRALSQTLYQLRRDLGDGWVTSDGSYLRCTDRLSTDAVDFERAAENGDFEAALDLYRGPFLKSCFLVSSSGFQQWTDRQESRLAALHRRVRTGRINELVRDGDMDLAIRCARGWVDLAPLEDEPRQHLMRLFLDAGERAAALRQFDAFSRLLEREGLAPLPETRELARAAREAPLRVTESPARTTIFEEGDVDGSGSQGRPAARGAAGALADVGAATGRGARSPPGRPGPVPHRWAIGAVVVVALGLAARAVFRSGDRSSPAATSAIEFVAVLPFEAEGDGELREFFVDGLQDGLIGNLSRLDDLRVMATRSVERYRGSTRLPSEIARELEVDALVQATVRRSADSVWVRANVIDADDRALGTATGARTVAETPDLLRELAVAIGSSLAPGLRHSGADLSVPLPPVDPEAYQAYLQAEDLVRDFRIGEWRRVVELYESAIAIDSSFGPPYAGIAMTYYGVGMLEIESQSQVWPEARIWANRALERDNGLSGAHTVLGFLALYNEWDWNGAETELVEALRLDRQNVTARHGWADLLALRGEPDAGLREIELARSVDPLSPLTNIPLAGHLHFARRFEEVVEEVRRERELFGRSYANAFFLACALWHLGRFDEALEQFRLTGIWRSDPELTRIVDQAYAGGGPTAALRAAADHLARKWEPGNGKTYVIARLYSRIGAIDEAFLWLDRAYVERTPTFLHFTAEPAFDILHPDPRFASLLRRVGLDPETGAPLTR